MISVVSSGAFGKVLQVIHKDDAKNYAMKIMSKSMVGRQANHDLEFSSSFKTYIYLADIQRKPRPPSQN